MRSVTHVCCRMYFQCAESALFSGKGRIGRGLFGNLLFWTQLALLFLVPAGLRSSLPSISRLILILNYGRFRIWNVGYGTPARQNMPMQTPVR